MMQLVPPSPLVLPRAARIHPESFLRIPLVRQMHEDPLFRPRARGVDASWAYRRHVPSAHCGFNPFLRTFFYGTESFFARWLEAPECSARDLNENDLLFLEVLYATHDYLHAWTLLAIHEALPELGIGTKAITRENIEDFVFAYLITEAAAVVGLDYWYLGAVDLDGVCPAGLGRMRLTSAYRRADEREYRRFNRAFDAQRPEFLSSFMDLYCTGSFAGFSPKHLGRSPRLLGWLEHELMTGEIQRARVREWFAYLSHDTIRYSEKELFAPVDGSAAWKRDLVDAVGRMLWRKVKEDERHAFGNALPESEVWRSPEDRDVDFRFVNYLTVDPEWFEWAANGPHAERNFGLLFHQYLLGFRYDTFDQELVKLFPFFLQKRDFGLVRHVLRHQERVPTVGPEPRDIYFLD